MAVEVLSLDNLSYFKTKQDAFNDAKFATKAQLESAIEGALSSALNYNGAKNSVAELPNENNKVGDMYYVTDDDSLYVWNGTSWDNLGGVTAGAGSVSWDDITDKPSTFAPSEHSHDVATTSSAGFMSAADKTRLDSLEMFTHTDVGELTSNMYKFTTDEYGHVVSGIVVTKGDITALGIPAQDTTYDLATADTNGLMASTDKAKLDRLNNTVAVENTEIDAMF